MKMIRATRDVRCECGFTLVEVLIYIALYALMFSGVLSAVYALIESSARDDAAAAVEEEGDYVIAKIGETVGQARSLGSDAGTSTSVSVVEPDGTTVAFTQCGTGLCEQDGSIPPERLNDPDSAISQLTFIIAADPETSITTSLILSATTSDGHALARDFYSLEYLRS